MPVIDFTQPFYLLAAVLLFVLCLYLGRNNKSNTVPCIMLLCFLTLLVGHTIELSNAALESVRTLAICILVDEAFIFVSFLSFLWIDKIQIKNKNNTTKGKKAKKDSKEKIEDKTVEDGLDILWKKV